MTGIKEHFVIPESDEFFDFIDVRIGGVLGIDGAGYACYQFIRIFDGDAVRAGIDK